MIDNVQEEFIRNVTRNTAYVTVTVSCHIYRWLAKAWHLLVYPLQ